MPEDREFQRRLPSVSRNVSGIKGEDIRVLLLGTVIEHDETMLVLDDGTGQISVTLPKEKPEIRPSMLIRVFGRVIPMEGGFEIQGEIIQDMGKLDMELYRKIQNMEEKANA
ncbi:MAG: replication protein RepA [Candidatus Aenigmarchaeota archaeon]|nr:replication protein RepA [Candidatus Aenigmarchaeota archaeon]